MLEKQTDLSPTIKQVGDLQLGAVSPDVQSLFAWEAALQQQGKHSSKGVLLQFPTVPGWYEVNSVAQPNVAEIANLVGAELKAVLGDLSDLDDLNASADSTDLRVLEVPQLDLSGQNAKEAAAKAATAELMQMLKERGVESNGLIACSDALNYFGESVEVLAILKQSTNPAILQDVMDIAMRKSFATEIRESDDEYLSKNWMTLLANRHSRDEVLNNLGELFKINSSIAALDVLIQVAKTNYGPKMLRSLKTIVNELGSEMLDVVLESGFLVKTQIWEHLPDTLLRACRGVTQACEHYGAADSNLEIMALVLEHSDGLAKLLLHLETVGRTSEGFLQELMDKEKLQELDYLMRYLPDHANALAELTELRQQADKQAAAIFLGGFLHDLMKGKMDGVANLCQDKNLLATLSELETSASHANFVQALQNILLITNTDSLPKDIAKPDWLKEWDNAFFSSEPAEVVINKMLNLLQANDEKAKNMSEDAASATRQACQVLCSSRVLAQFFNPVHLYTVVASAGLEAPKLLQTAETLFQTPGLLGQVLSAPAAFPELTSVLNQLGRIHVFDLNGVICKNDRQIWINGHDAKSKQKVQASDFGQIDVSHAETMFLSILEHHLPAAMQHGVAAAITTLLDTRDAMNRGHNSSLDAMRVSKGDTSFYLKEIMEGRSQFDDFAATFMVWQLSKKLERLTEFECNFKLRHDAMEKYGRDGVAHTCVAMMCARLQLSQGDVDQIMVALQPAIGQYFAQHPAEMAKMEADKWYTLKVPVGVAVRANDFYLKVGDAEHTIPRIDMNPPERQLPPGVVDLAVRRVDVRAVLAAAGS